MRRPTSSHLFLLSAICSLLFINLYVYRSLSQTGLPTKRHDLPKFEPNQCGHATCFDVAACAQLHPGYAPHRIRVHVYSVDGVHASSRESVELISAIRNSRYFAGTPEVACLFVPDMDLLNGRYSHFDDTLNVLLSDNRYGNGTNKVIFNILHGETLAHPGMALVVSGDRPMSVYRKGFDVAIPFYNPMAARLSLAQSSQHYRRNFLVVFPSEELMKSPASLKALLSTDQISSSSALPSAQNIILLGNSPVGDFRRRPALLSASRHSQLTEEVTVDYAETIADSLFCALLTDDMLALFDSLRFGCIPVLVGHRSVPLPFHEVLDWSRLAVHVEQTRLPDLASALASYTRADVRQFQQHIEFIYERYFSSVARITVTVLDLINDRVFPMYARSYQAWNDQEHTTKWTPIGAATLFYPTRMSSDSQFTALVRAHFYFARLHQLLTRLQYAQGLQRIVVVWTNAENPQPADILWPPLRVPLTVIAVENANKYGRFHPFVQIKTDAVLSIDDSQCLPSLDDIARAFELWRQNPNSLIGLDGGWSPFQGWSELSPSAFGVSFFHKHYLHAYSQLTAGTLHDLSRLLFDSFCDELLMNALIVRLSESQPLVFVSVEQPGQMGSLGTPVCERQHGAQCSRHVGNISHRLTGWWRDLLHVRTIAESLFTVEAV